MQKGNIRITITGEEGDYLLIADTIKGYKGKIDKSLLVANNIEVVNDEIFVCEVLHYHWFKEHIDAVNEKAFQELCDLFYSNLKLFWEKREIILKDPRLYSIISPKPFRDGMYIGGKPITLGEMLMLWKNETVFSLKCDCGGRSVIYYCAGSILTGTVFSIKSVCLQCGKSYAGKSQPCSFGAFFHAINKYHPIEPIAERPASIKNLVDFLQGRRGQIDDTEYDEIQYVPDDNMSISIGGKTISNNTFAAIITGKNNKNETIRK